MENEVPLSGGNVASSVVRIGDTVRKAATPFDIATNALLKRLEYAGVAGVPRTRGYDAQGRRILTWVAGETTFPKDMWCNNRTLTSAAQFLRRIHDASLPLVLDKLTWAYSADATDDALVIGHSDFAPYNMTFAADGSVAGVFDFDLAGPAPRLRDLAYLAWWLVPLGQSEAPMAAAKRRDAENGSPRLHALARAYGCIADTSLLEWVARVLSHMSDPAATKAMIGEDATEKLIADGHLAHWKVAGEHFADLRPTLEANLGRSDGGALV